MLKSILKSLKFGALLAPLAVFAQINTISPYSYFGLGELSPAGLAQNQSLGGVGIGMNDALHLNLINPASYGALSLTTFETGINGRVMNLSDGTLEREHQSTSLSYIALGFPIAEGFGMSLGIIPYSSVGYELSQDQQDISSNNDTINLSVLHAGSGGLNRIFMGFGGDIYKGLSVGLNGNFLFGRFDKTLQVSSDDQNFINSRDVNSLVVKDLSFQAGIQYEMDVNEKQLVLGATITPSAKLSADVDELIYTYQTVGTNEYFRDTVSYVSNGEGFLKMPMSLGTGFSYSKDKNWLFAMDYKWQEWSSLELTGATDPRIQNSNNWSAGMWWVPNHKDVHRYFSRVEYRMGLQYNSGNLMLNAEGQSGPDAVSINEYSLSLGVGMPMNKTFSTTNIGIVLGKKGTVESNLIEESFMRFHLTFTFNDKWFNKRKID
jgi:hypothetical protein